MRYLEKPATGIRSFQLQLGATGIVAIQHVGELKVTNKMSNAHRKLTRCAKIDTGEASQAA